MNSDTLTPPYIRYLARLIRWSPNFDFFFIKPLRQKAVNALQLQPGSRVLDVGCGPGGAFPYLVGAVGASGQVVGVEISPEVAINARKRIEANRWNNVQVVEGDAATVCLHGEFDGLVMFAAPDVYATPESLANLLPYLKQGARIVLVGAKVSRRASAALPNLLFRWLMKLSFSSTPKLNDEPWCVLKNQLADLEVTEYFGGCMFLAWGTFRPMPTLCAPLGDAKSPYHK